MQVKVVPNYEKKKSPWLWLLMITLVVIIIALILSMIAWFRTK